MTTPAINTPVQIIADALTEAGKLAEGQTPSSEQFKRGMSKLNMMVNLWQTQGLKLWLQVDQTVTLVEGFNGPYQMFPGGEVDITKPLRVEQGYYLDSSGNRRPLFPLSWNEWLTLSNLSQTGAITQYFIDKQQTSLNVWFWLTPDATAVTGEAHLMTQYQVQNTINLTEEMNFPKEWGLALVWGLADELCGGQPQVIMDRCQQRAIAYRAMLEDWDVEDTSTSFAPDTQRGYSSNSFT